MADISVVVPFLFVNGGIYMSCKSALYAVNSTVQSLPIGGAVNFGNIIRRYGQNLSMMNGNPIVKGIGYYDLDVNLSLSSAVEGIAVVQILKDGAAIPGATSTFSVDASDNVSVTIPAMFRKMECIPSTITVTVSGVASSISNASISIKKI